MARYLIELCCVDDESSNGYKTVNKEVTMEANARQVAALATDHLFFREDAVGVEVSVMRPSGLAPDRPFFTAQKYSV